MISLSHISGAVPLRGAQELPMQIESRPQVERPVGVVVHVVTEPVGNGDTPMVYGGYALLKRDGTVVQTRLQEFGTATTHSQGVLMMLAHTIERLPEDAVKTRFAFYLPDACALSLLHGETTARTPKVRELLATVRRLVEQRCPRAEFRHGRFRELARGRAFEDRWA